MCALSAPRPPSPPPARLLCPLTQTCGTRVFRSAPRGWPSIGGRLRTRDRQGLAGPSRRGTDSGDPALKAHCHGGAAGARAGQQGPSSCPKKLRVPPKLRQERSPTASPGGGGGGLLRRSCAHRGATPQARDVLIYGGGGSVTHGKMRRYPNPPLQGAQPMPSHCLPDAKCQLQPLWQPPPTASGATSEAPPLLTHDELRDPPTQSLGKPRDPELSHPHEGGGGGGCWTPTHPP